MTLSTRVRQRLRDEFAHRKVSQRALADQLTRLTDETWTQSRVHKVLAGYVQLQVDDMAALAYLAGLSVVDLVREPNREFVADLTPSELRLLTAIREHPELSAVLVQFLAVQTRTPSRRTVRERMRALDDEDER